MKYAIYKNVRNASWQCLIDCNVTNLPIKPVRLAALYGIKCKAATKEELRGASGEIVAFAGEVFISFREDDPPQRQRFTIMHELGHYLLGHLGTEPMTRSESDCRPEEEQAADKFAIDMLAPACVLWALNLHAPDEIARACNISMQAAENRARRMDQLYRRNMFLTHPLERIVFQQFRRFIESQK